MKNLLNSLWCDDSGFVVSAELVLISTLGVIGLVAGLSQVRGAVLGELEDVGDSIRSLDQSYSYGGFKGCKAFTAGSAFYEDGREVEIEFTEIYEEKPCVKPAVCPPVQEILQTPCQPVITPCEKSPCGVTPCQDCLPAPKSPCQEPLSSPCNSCEGNVSSPCPTTTIVPTPATALPTICCQAEAYSSTQYGQSAVVGSGAFLPATVYAGRYPGVDGNPQKVVLPYHHSIYNVKRYIDTPYVPFAPHLAPRSSVW